MRKLTNLDIQALIPIFIKHIVPFAKHIPFIVIAVLFLMNIMQFIGLIVQNKQLGREGSMYPERIIPSDVAAFVGYEESEDGYISIDIDPNIYLPAINEYIDNLILEFSSDVSANIQIFYTSKYDNYTEEESIIQIISGKKCTFQIGKFVKNIRMDIGNIIGVTFRDFKITINDPQLNRDLLDLQIFRKFIICLLLLFMASVCFILIYFNRLDSKFFFILLSCGFIYMLVITPLSVPDELDHITSTITVSDNIFGFTRTNIDEIRIPNGAAGHYNVKESYLEFVRNILKLDSSSNLIRSKPAEGLTVGSLSYLISAIGISVGKFLYVNNLLSFYSGRLFNLLFFCLIIAFSVRIIPEFKTQVMLLSLMPMTMQQAASYSYDAPLNALAILLVSYIIKLALADKKITRKEFILLIILSLALVPLKSGIYALLVLLIFIIPKENFDSKKYFYMKGYAVVCLILLVFVVVNVTDIQGTVSTGGDELNWEGGHNYTLSFAIHNPIQTVIIFFRSFIQLGGVYLKTFIGSNLSGWTLAIPLYLIVMYGMLLLLSCTNQKTTIITSNLKKRGLIFSVFGIIFIGIMASMFFGWTSDTRATIIGVQGRYFIPIALPLAVVLSNNIFTSKYNLQKVFVFIAVMFNIVIIMEALNTTIGI